MQVSSPDQLRNVAVVGHNTTGKTTLVSALLYAGGVANRLNKVEDGHTVTDFDPEEVERGISINLAACYVPWNGNKINLIDTPGMSIFMSDTKAGLRAADTALLCVDMVSGPQVNTEAIWEFTDRMDIPVAFHLTRADRENADFERAVSAIQELFGRTALPVQLPIGNAQGFEGVIDLIDRRAYRYERDGDGKGKVEDVPADLEEAVEEWRNQLIEAVAESDEFLMEAYFEAGDLTHEQFESGLRRALRKRAVFPITLSSGLHSIGISALLDHIEHVFSVPTRHAYPATDLGGEPLDLDKGPEAPASALVFKTYHDPHSGKMSLLRVMSGTIDGDSNLFNVRAEQPERLGALQLIQGKSGQSAPKLVSGDIAAVAKLKVTETGDTLASRERPVRLNWAQPTTAAIAFAIEPKSKGDEEKIGEAVQRLVEEDPSLHSGRDPQTGEYLLSGSGQLHVEIAVERLKKRYNVEVILHPPKVPYRETVRKSADGHGRHKKQTGGRGQFADCRIRLEPLPRGGEFEFVDEIFGGAIPQNYRPAVEKGIREASQRGYLAGYPVVDFRIRLQDGQYHDVDSSEMAFKIAGSLAFKDAMSQAGPTLLEPMMQVEITTTEDFMGDIMSDLSQRRGKPQGMEAKGASQVIKAVVPMAEMLNYAPALRSMTQGRSNFVMTFSHYEEVPKNVQDKIIAEAKQAEAAQA